MNDQQKLTILRKEMAANGVEAVILPTADPHQSEYIANHFKSRCYFSGFTGSAGTLVVLASQAALWTDGRYFIQAEQELDASFITLMKMGEETTPSIAQYLTSNLPSGSKVSIDGRLVSVAFYQELYPELANSSIELIDQPHLLDNCWPSRPSLPYHPITDYDLIYSGLSTTDKLAAVQKILAKYHASSYFISSLDDIAWLTNLRGSDIDYTPVFYAYMLVSPSQHILFTHLPSLTPHACARLKEANIIVKNYDDAYHALKELDGSIALDLNRTSAMIYNIVKSKNKVIAINEITASLKAQKNSTEIDAFKAAHLKDAIAMTKFLYWLSTTDRGSLTDWDCMLKVEALRAEQEGFISHSFTPIFALGANGAIVHRHATAENASNINHDGFMVLDSGAHYLGGTTDITRTIAFGTITPEQKKHYTLVLKAHIALANSIFLEGAAGAQLDGITRQALWQEFLDFKHGTGHGVGAMLSVHEGPQRINQTLVLPIKRNMVTSIEPGLYLASAYGIRLENLYYSYLAAENEFGSFLKFEVLSLAPFLLEAIDKQLLSSSEIFWINSYHKRVYEALHDKLSAEELTWLALATKAI